MRAEDFIKSLNLIEHEEGGYFRECNEDNPKQNSGAIYYYLGPKDKSTFHMMDEEDEYWCHLEGSSLEIWELDESGQIRIMVLGKGKDENPFLLVKAGTIFGAKHKKEEGSGTLCCCITCPRFKDEVIFSKEEIIQRFPLAASFYD